MSLVLQSSGGGQITIQEPATASNFTQTLPAATGTVMVSGNMPAFSAYASASQSLATSTYLKLQFNTKEFDTATAYDSTTNYRFTPQVAGYYQVNSEVGFSAAANNTTAVFLVLYKNGSIWRYTQLPSTTAGNGTIVSMSQLIYLNGSTDYIEMYAYQNTGGTINVAISGQQYNYFQATMVRAA